MQRDCKAKRVIRILTKKIIRLKQEIIGIDAKNSAKECRLPAEVLELSKHNEKESTKL
jgi:hypothetical protein